MENRKQLLTFCNHIINGLISMEKKVSKKPSTMNHFVRLDIGVIEEDGKYYYFVNEVTRALEMSLFSRTLKDMDFIKVAGNRVYQSIKELVESNT